MAKRQNSLAAMMKNNGIALFFPEIINKYVFLESKYHEEILSVYQSLGGILDDYPIGFGNFDIITANYFVEFDEENHFNCYRKLTLNSSLYENYKFFSVEDYLNYCDLYKNKGGKGGKFWTTPGSEKQFGVSSPPNDFKGNGPARWKQRAFYDYLKDVYATIIKKPVYRFSIYDEINGISIDTILKKEKNEEDLIKHLLDKLNERKQ